MPIFLSVKDDLIKHETDKAILVNIKESLNQIQMFENVEREDKEIWIPKSLINKDWKITNRITIPTWFYEQNF